MSRRILMIDDDRLQFRLTTAYFRNFRAKDYELEWADDYDSGLARLLAGGYAACLIDYKLGERDGLQLIREAVARGCRTPLIVLTADSSERVDIEAMHAGALDYLVKGEITPQALERSLRYALKLGETLEALREMATHDDLTGLLNRREFDRMLAQEAERARRFGQPLTLVMADIDRFKEVNDRHGHPAGDAALREVAGRLAAAARTVDRVGRYGGDEFAVILVQADRAAAREVAERLAAAVSGTPVAAGGELRLSLTLSAGIAVLPEDGSTEGALLAAADRALYAAKALGRNRAAGFDPAQL